jgi:hypothetical protein
MSKLLTQEELESIKRCEKSFIRGGVIIQLLEHIEALTAIHNTDITVKSVLHERAKIAEAELNRRDALAGEPVTTLYLYESEDANVCAHVTIHDETLIEGDRVVKVYAAPLAPAVPDEAAPIAEIIQALGVALSALISHGRDVPEVTKEYIADVLTRYRAAMLDKQPPVSAAPEPDNNAKVALNKIIDLAKHLPRERPIEIQAQELWDALSSAVDIADNAIAESIFQPAYIPDEMTDTEAFANRHIKASNYIQWVKGYNACREDMLAK